MNLQFTKMHGLGNDFVVFEDLSAELALSPEAVRWLCDRNFGIGADGVILVRRAEAVPGGLAMAYFNADGTQAEMCGNGIRCFAKYAVDRELAVLDRDSMEVETLGGLKSLTVSLDSRGAMEAATVDMGIPVLTPSDIPANFDGEYVYECPIETEEGEVHITAVSMGNPHAVIWVDDVDEAPVDTLGPIVETHAVFPNRTNVEFAQIAGEDLIRLRVWERGVGETLACGTGACATLVAAVLGCRTGRSATIELPGGDLEVRWDGSDEHVYMTGPAAEVFTGSLWLDEDAGE